MPVPENVITINKNPNARVEYVKIIKKGKMSFNTANMRLIWYLVGDAILK